MNSIKITMLAKRRFKGFYDVKIYRKQSSAQFAVKQYRKDNPKIIIDEEK